MTKSLQHITTRSIRLVRQLWDHITYAPESLPLADQHSVKLLSTLLVAMLALSATYQALYLVAAPRATATLETLETFGLLIALGIAYGVNRAGRVKLAANLTVAIMSAGVFSLTLTAAWDPTSAQMLVFLMIPVLIGNIFFGRRHLLISVGLMTAAMVGLVWLLPTVDMLWLVTGPIPFLFISTCIISISRGHRDQQERDRQRQLAESERRFRALFEQAPVAVFILDLQGRGVAANESATSMLGYAQEDVTRLSVNDVSAQPIESEQVLDRLMRGESIPPHERLLRRKSGETLSVEVHLALIRDESGHPYRIQAIARDITERKQAEEALGRSEQRFHALTEYAPDGVVIYGPSGRIEYASTAASRLLGYSMDEAKQVDLYEVTHPDDLPDLTPVFNRVVQAPGAAVTAQYRMRHRNGSWRWLESTISNCFEVPGIDGLVFNFRDITERRLAQDQIRLQLQRLRALHLIDRVISSSFDVQLCLTAILDGVIEQLGVSAAAVLLFDEPTHTLEFAAGKGFKSAAIQKARFRMGEGVIGKVALEQRAVHIQHLAPNSRQLSELGGDDILQPGEPAESAAVSFHALPLIAKGTLKGVLTVLHAADLEPDHDWLGFLETLGEQAAIAIDHGQTFRRLQRTNLELRLAYDATIEGWSRAMELRDRETEGHTQRVTELTLQLAKVLGVEEEQLVHIRRGALLHDMGKLGVPDSILHKPGRLTVDEWNLMQKHPQYAYDMLAPIAYLRPALDIPYGHHERWDGRGYPRGLRGEQIPLAARIFAVVDVWDALRSDRPYRESWPAQKVLDHLRVEAGTHLDPYVVQAFISMLAEETDEPAQALQASPLGSPFVLERIPPASTSHT